MTPTQVLALRPAAGGYRLAWARERLQDAFWPIPALFLVAGALLAAGTVYAPSLGLTRLFPRGPCVDNGEAASVLGIIASATLTFLGVVTGYYADDAGQVRFVEPVMGWGDYLDLAFTGITSYGAGSPQVVRRLLAACQTLERRLAPGLAGAIRLRPEELLTQAAGQGVGPELARPDAMGLG